MDRTKEFESTMLQFTITKELGAGCGAISAPEHLNDTEAHEMAGGIREHVVEAGAEHGCGCYDGRCVAHLLNGNEGKVGPKTAGGTAISALFAMEIAN